MLHLTLVAAGGRLRRLVQLLEVDVGDDDVVRVHLVEQELTLSLQLLVLRDHLQCTDKQFTRNKGALSASRPRRTLVQQFHDLYMTGRRG